MQADRHHLRLAFALEIETVEGGLEIVEEIVARHPAGVGREVEVIRVERIGDEQTRLASDGRPIGEIVDVTIRIVEGLRLLGDESRVLRLNRPVYQPSGGAPVILVMVLTVLRMSSRSSSSGMSA
jgi:hypothetical protein